MARPTGSHRTDATRRGGIRSCESHLSGRAGLALGAAALVASALAAPTSATAADPGDRADVSSSLVTQLSTLRDGAPTAVMVHGATLQQARDAVAATGMTAVTSFDRIGVVVATGTGSQVQAVRSEPGVTYVEGNQRRSTSSRTAATSPPAATRPPRP